MTSGRDKGGAGECVERKSSLWFVIMGLMEQWRAIRGDEDHRSDICGR
jgi:hypothetical protein